MSYIYNLTDTWNAAGTTFAGIKMAVTNTASSASSRLLDLSVSGATTATFYVDKSGSLTLNGSITSGTFFWDSTNSRLGVGTTSPAQRLDVRTAATGIQIVGADATADATGKIFRVGGAHYTNAQAPITVFLCNSQAGSSLITIGGGTGVMTATTEIRFNTAATTTTLTGTERLRITSAGNIHPPAGSTSMAAGFLYMPSAAGTPTGVPTAISGTVPFYYDTTNDLFYVYNGGWKKVALTV